MSSDIRQVIREQNRRRRQYFWAGFLVIALLGSLWAGLSKDPRGPGFFQDDIVVDEAEFVEDRPLPPLATTTAPPPFTTAPESSPDGSFTTTTAPTNAPTTVPPTTTTRPPSSSTTGSEADQGGDR